MLMKLNITKAHDEEANLNPRTEPKVSVGQQIDAILLRCLMEGSRITDLRIHITPEEWEAFKSLHAKQGWTANAAYEDVVDKPKGEAPLVTLPKTNAIM
jgi:hypothetical protein